MTIEEKLDRAVDALSANARGLTELTGIVNTLANSVIAHDNQIEALLRLAEKHEAAIANLEKQWQAYLNTLPRN